MGVQAHGRRRELVVLGTQAWCRTLVRTALSRSKITLTSVASDLTYERTKMFSLMLDLQSKYFVV